MIIGGIKVYISIQLKKGVFPLKKGKNTRCNWQERFLFCRYYFKPLKIKKNEKCNFLHNYYWSTFFLW